LRQKSAVVFCDVDSLVPIRGKTQAGFDEFCAMLEHAGIPAVWVSSRSRAQLDEPIRRLGHRHPFIAENGSAAYLPEGYFNLRPVETIRLGRFTCIPVAELQPAASEALERLSEDTGVHVVPLTSLSPRERAQNLGLPGREAELAGQRDFEEGFFFAGASEAGIANFQEQARRRKLVLRKRGMLWSLSVGGDLGQAIRELAKLYGRALRLNPSTIGVTTAEAATSLLPACDRRVLLRRQEQARTDSGRPKTGNWKEYSLSDPQVWEEVLSGISPR
jgi:mannosyl-3-phosphoglycerate phosphatase